MKAEIRRSRHGHHHNVRKIPLVHRVEVLGWVTVHLAQSRTTWEGVSTRACLHWVGLWERLGGTVCSSLTQEALAH